LIEILKKAGVYDKTLIVFTSDHGMAFSGGKTTVYEGGLKVPFVVRNPYEDNRGVVSEALISHIDITPTLLDFADGLDEATNGPKEWDDPDQYWQKRGVRDRKYKLIWNIAHPLPYPFASDLWVASSWQAQFQKGLDAPYGKKTVAQYIHRPEFELYNIESDPHESVNLASNPEFSEILKKYQRKLKEFQAKMNDPWIMKWDYE